MKTGTFLLIAAAVIYVVAVILTMSDQKTFAYIAYLVASSCLISGWNKHKKDE